MRYLLTTLAVLGLLAWPAFAGDAAPPRLPSTGLLTVTAAVVVGAIFLARRKR